MDVSKVRERLDLITKNHTRRQKSSRLLLKAIDKNDISFVNKTLPKVKNLDENVYTGPGPSKTLLCRACEIGNTSLVKILLSYGADINKVSESRETPLKIAVKLNHIPISALLIDSGAELISESFNASHDACKFGFYEIVALILKENKININIQDKDGNTALHDCVKNFKLNICQLLIEKKCDLDIQNSFGNTSLHEACQTKWINLRNQKDMVIFLLKNGASSDRENCAGYSPRQLCHNEEISKLFLLKHEHVSSSVTIQLPSDKKGENKDPTSFEPLQEFIKEVDSEIEKLKIELESSTTEKGISRKRFQLSYEKEQDIRRLLRKKIRIRKEINQELSNLINGKSNIIETFLSSFLKCCR